MNAPAIRPIIRAKDFFKVTGIPDSTRADWEDPDSPRFDSTFPPKYKLGQRYTIYYLDEIVAWLESRQAKQLLVKKVPKALKNDCKD